MSAPPPTPVPTSSPGPVRKDTRFRRLFRLMVDAAMIACLVLLSAYWQRAALLEDSLRDLLVKTLRQETGTELRVDQIRGSYVSDAELRDLIFERFEDAPQIRSLHIDRLQLRYDPVVLAQGDLQGLEGVFIDGAHLVLDLDRTSPSEEKAEDPEPFPEFSATPFPAIDARRLTVTVLASGHRLDVTGLTLESDGGRLGRGKVRASWDRAELRRGGHTLLVHRGSLTLEAENERFRLSLLDETAERILVILRIEREKEDTRLSLTADLHPGEDGSLSVKCRCAWPLGNAFETRIEGKRLDLSLLSAMLPPSAPALEGNLEFFVRAGGASFDPSSWTGQTTLRLKDFTWGRIRPGSLIGGATLSENRRLTADLRSVRPESELRTRIECAWNGPFHWVTSVDTPDLSRVFPQAPSLPFRGRLTFTGSTKHLEKDFHLQARFLSSWENLAGLPSASFQTDLGLNARSLEFRNAEFSGPGARVFTEGRLDWSGSPSLNARVRVLTPSVQSLLPPAVIPGFDIAGDADITGEVTVADRSFSARGRLRTERLDVVGLRLRNLASSFHLTENGIDVHDLSGRVQGLDALIPTARVHWGGTGLRIRASDLALSWPGGGMTSKGQVNVHVHDSGVSVSPFHFAGPSGLLKGRIALTQDRCEGRITADLPSLSALPPLLRTALPKSRGALTLDLAARGSAEAPEGTLTASCRNLQLADLPPLTGRIEGGLQKGMLTVKKMSVASEWGELNVQGSTPFAPGSDPDPHRWIRELVENPRFRARVSGRIRDLSRLPDLRSAGITGRLSFKLGVEGPLSAPGISGTLTGLNIGSGKTTAKKIRLRLRANREGLLVERGSLRLPYAEIVVRGLIPLRLGPQPDGQGSYGWRLLDTPKAFDLDLNIREIELEDLLKSVSDGKEVPRLTGRGSLGLKIDGTWNSPAATLEGRLTRLEAPWLSRQLEAEVKAQLSRGRVTLSRLHIDTKTGTLSGSGDMALRLDPASMREGRIISKDDPIRFSVDLVHVDPALLLRGLPELKTLSADVSGAAAVSGTWSNPNFLGNIVIRNGALSLRDPALPRLDAVKGTINLTNRKVRLDLGAESSGGKIRAVGSADLESWAVKKIDLTLKGSERPLVLAGPPARIRANFDLHLSGSPADALLSGSVRVLRTRIGQRMDLSDSSSGEGGLLPGFSFPAVKKLRLAINVTTPEMLNVNSEITQAGFSVANIDAEIRGDLRIEGDSRHPYLTGVVRARRGHADLPLYQVRLVNAQAVFFERAPNDPQVNILGKTVRSGRTIFISVNGPLSDPAISFRSEPPMPEHEIKVYLATGVSQADWRGSKAGETLGVQLLTLVARQISPYIFGRSEGESLLDRLDISSRRDPVSLKMTYRATFRLFDWLFLEGEYDDQGQYQGGIMATFGFKLR